MRSQLVDGALLQVPNRYLLCTVAAKALRKLHRPMSRIQDTTNDVFILCCIASPIAEPKDPTVQQMPTTPQVHGEKILMSIPPSWLSSSEEVRV
jgi:hypothetical protein